MYKIEVGQYRSRENVPMQAVSGSIEREKVYYKKPNAQILHSEMNELINYINNDNKSFN